MPLIPPNDTTIIKSFKFAAFWKRDIKEIFKAHAFQKFTPSDLAVLCRKFSFLLDANISIKSIISTICEERNVKFLVLREVNNQITSGMRLSKALDATGAFPPFMIGFIAVGERTAQLPKVFNELAEYYEARAEAATELKAAMMYPIVITIMMLGVIILAITTVLPGYAAVFESSGIELPLLTSLLLNFSQFINTHTLWIILGFVIIIVTVFGVLRMHRFQVFIAHKLLMFKSVRLSINFKIVQSLSVLLSAGVSIAHALSLCTLVTDNKYVEEEMHALSSKVNQGVALSEAMSTITFLDPVVKDLAQIGEATGDLTQIMQKCSKYFNEMYMRQIKRLNKLIEPMITIILGVLLTIVVLAVVMPTFELATKM